MMVLVVAGKTSVLLQVITGDSSERNEEEMND
jgi:hypothetical protein